VSGADELKRGVLEASAAGAEAKEALARERGRFEEDLRILRERRVRAWGGGVLTSVESGGC
jgi:hypothetical protein